MTNEEGWTRYAKPFLEQTGYILSTFDIQDSIFAFFKVYFPIRLAAVQASGVAPTRY